MGSLAPFKGNPLQRLSPRCPARERARGSGFHARRGIRVYPITPKTAFIAPSGKVDENLDHFDDGEDGVGEIFILGGAARRRRRDMESTAKDNLESHGELPVRGKNMEPRSMV
jgi:hypothetical protein